MNFLFLRVELHPRRDLTAHIEKYSQFNNSLRDYHAKNRLVTVTGAATAAFVYDGDSKQVKATVNGVTTYYVGNHYEVKNGTV